MSTYVDKTSFPAFRAPDDARPAVPAPKLYGERIPAAAPQLPSEEGFGPENSVLTQAAVKKKAARKQKKKAGTLTVYSLLFAAGLLAMLYITHQFAMQKLLEEVGAAQRELDRVQMIHEARVLRYEQLTGPSEVFSRARELGFEHAGPADYVIERRR